MERVRIFIIGTIEKNKRKDQMLMVGGYPDEETIYFQIDFIRLDHCGVFSHFSSGMSR